MSVCVPGVAAVKNSAESGLLAITQAIAASVLDAPLNCTFQAPLARLPLNRATWPMCPVMLVVRPIQTINRIQEYFNAMANAIDSEY